MAPSRRLSNGRSPVVNPQRQITSFFTPGKSPISPPPSISLKESPSPSPSPSPNPNPSPPFQTKRKKPVLVVGPSPARRSPNSMPSSELGKTSYSGDVVGKRIRVFWPLDKSWYEGWVKSFDDHTGKHVVQYDDAEEEVLDLGNEKIEWVEDVVRSFRRLRRSSVCEEVVPEKEEVVDDGSGGNDGGDGDDNDDSMDEDWEKNVGKEEEDGASEEVELDEDDEEVERSRRGRARNSGSAKRKKIKVEKLGSGKKSRVSGSGEKGASKAALDWSGSKTVRLPSNAESK